MLARFSGLLPRHGLAFDMACGNARNSLYLARRGLRVIAADRSRKVLERGRELAGRVRPAIAFLQADLTLFSLPCNVFQLIICFNYRNPALYPALRAALRPRGLLIYETYTREHRKSGARPRNPAHWLERGELLRAFAGWPLIFYREVWMGRGIASLVARKP